MVYRVHRHTANMRPVTKPTVSSRFAKFFAFVLPVADLADTGTTGIVEFSHLTGRQPNEYVTALLGHQLRRHSGTPYQLGSFANLHLDIMDDRTERNIGQRQAVAGLDIDILSGDNGVTNRNSIGERI
jgi:hypothetical protein